MTHDPLKSLLQRADAQSEPSLLPAGELTCRVELVASRRLQRRAVSVTAVSIVLVIIGWTAWRGSWNNTPAIADGPAMAAGAQSSTSAEAQFAAQTPDEVQRILEEVAALEAEANLHLQTAHRMIADRQHDATLTLARRAMTDEEPAEVVRERLDLVAYRMIARADRLRNEPRQGEDPVEIYREIVRLFPTTDSAAEARLRLAELHPIQPPGGA